MSSCWWQPEQYGQDPRVQSPLCIASSCGHIHVVELLLRAGAQVDTSVGAGYTPLYLAAQGGYEGCVAQLLAAGAPTELATADGATPLLVACHQGQADCVHLLLTHGARTTVSGMTALSVATNSRHSICVSILTDFEEWRGMAATQQAMHKVSSMIFDPHGSNAS